MKVLFLDFDGVLNHPGTYARLSKRYETKVDCRESEWLEERLVRRLGDLCMRLGLVVSVVSTWRHRHDRASLETMLRERGWPAEVRVDSCNDLCSKGDAIREYLKTNPVRSYVVLDDGPGELPHPSRLVKTDGAVGMTPADEDAIARLFA